MPDDGQQAETWGMTMMQEHIAEATRLIAKSIKPSGKGYPMDYQQDLESMAASDFARLMREAEAQDVPEYGEDLDHD